MNTPIDKPDTQNFTVGENPEADGMATTGVEPIAVKPVETPIDLTPVFSDMGKSEQEHRRMALRSMLAATEARQQGSKRTRSQTLAAGLRVGVKAGEHAGTLGTILDADYIHSRVLVDFGEEKPAAWVNFNFVSALPPDLDGNNEA